MTMDGSPEPPLQQRADARNTLGGPVRTGNKNPGQGVGGDRGPHSPRPVAEQIARTVLGAPPSADEEVGDSVERGIARSDFRGWLDTPVAPTETNKETNKRKAILEAMFRQALAGNVMAARVLMSYDLGLPVAATEFTNKTPLSGKLVGESIEAALQKRREQLEAEGVDVSLIDKLLDDEAVFANGIAPLSEDGPSGT